ncbi:Transcription factor iws1 [Perkinsus chesapeaki]|uniref:Transcription factor iws1 n=1 Tax=Perkinsus chesapeaki TaxID=330153 RepID=A0A7J6N4J2_PERCH|nr:Transcription factor iws1 [Perkinsus chesapeaki]
MSDENWNELFGEDLDDLPIAQTQVARDPEESGEPRLRKGLPDDESEASAPGNRAATQEAGSPAGESSESSSSSSSESEGEDGEMGHSLERKPRESKLLQPALDRLKKRRKKKELDSGEKFERMEALVNSMYDASAADRDSIANGQPALAKLQMMEKVRGILVKQAWQEPFIEAGGLSAIADWLALVGTKAALPNFNVRKTILDLLNNQLLPHITLDALKTSRVGWAVKDMYYHKDETTENTVVEEQLIQHWLKLIQNQGSEQRGHVSRYIKATEEDMRIASRAIQKQKGPRLTVEQQRKVQSRRHAMIPNRGIALDSSQPLSGAGTYRIQPVSNVEAAHKERLDPGTVKGRLKRHLMSAGGKSKKRSSKAVKGMRGAAVTSSSKSPQNSAYYWVMKLREEHQEAAMDSAPVFTGLMPHALAGKTSGQSTSVPSPRSAGRPSVVPEHDEQINKATNMREVATIGKRAADGDAHDTPDFSESYLHENRHSERPEDVSYDDASDSSISCSSSSRRRPASSGVTRGWAAYSARLHYERDRSRHRWVHPEWEERSLLRQKLLLKIRKSKGEKVTCELLDEFTDPPFPDQAKSRRMFPALFARHAFTEDEAAEYALAIGKARLVTYHSKWGEYNMNSVSQLLDIAIYNNVVPSEKRVQHLAKKFAEASQISPTLTT